MRIELIAGEYTQINTNGPAYLFQNLSEYAVDIVVSASQPTPNASNDYRVKGGQGIGNNDIVGILWGKPTSKKNTQVGLVEG